MAPFQVKIKKVKSITPSINAIFKPVANDKIDSFNCSVGRINSSFINRVCYNTFTKQMKIVFDKNGIKSEYEYDDINLIQAQRMVDSPYPRRVMKPDRARSIGASFRRVVLNKYTYRKIR